MKRPHDAGRSTPDSQGHPPRPDASSLQDVWSGWTDETIPALFTHLYLFRLAAHMVLPPAELRAIANKVGQLTRDLKNMNDPDDEGTPP
ncbi:MAG: hypothetical protein E2576_12000 [Alcaligenaceae bacterium]|nr:hypothetical protein [Alcaligenaceae bacterium SAGV5]MPT57435.1 hypothetical protein [Alcaligenaceae bacterium]